MRFIFTLFCLLLGSSFLFGAHIIGGGMTFECLGPDPDNPGSNIYGFTMKVYRDCQGGGAAFDSAPSSFTNATITLFRELPDNAGYDIDSILALPTSALEIFTINPDSIVNPCVVVPPNVCVEEGVYSWQFSLPIIDESYVISYQRCCRNGTITNILFPGDQGATYTVEVTSLSQQECNNSPQFVGVPPIVICVNEPLNFDYSAEDPEGDLLIYSLCPPLTGGGSTGAPNDFDGVAPSPDAPPPYQGVNFIAPTYSADNPLIADPPIEIYPSTGIITGTPTAQGQFVVGICVEEYRNGQLLSITQQEFQFNVTFCESAVSAITDEIEVAIDTIDDNTGQEVTLEWQEYRSCNDTSFTFENFSGDPDFIEGYLWEFDRGDTVLQFTTKDVTVNFPGPGTYLGTMIVNPDAGSDCSDTANLVVQIAPPLSTDFDFKYDTCVADSVQFIELTDTTLGSNVVQWSWLFGDGVSSGMPEPKHLYKDPGTYNTTLVVTDTFGCQDIVSKPVTWFPVPPLIIVDPSRFVGCPPVDVAFENLSEPIDTNYKVVWRFGDGDTLNQLNATHRYDSVGKFTVQLEITSPIGCFTDTTYQDWITVFPVPEADFAFEPQSPTNFEPEIQLTDLSFDSIVGWKWIIGKDEDEIVKIQNPTYSFRDTGLQKIMLTVANQYYCEDTITKMIDVIPQIKYFLPNAFSPNGDGKNDQFVANGYFVGLNSFQIKILDRYGGLVFQTSDPYIKWNGRQNNSGKLLQNGVYVCRISYRGPRGKPYSIDGFVTLIR